MNQTQELSLIMALYEKLEPASLKELLDLMEPKIAERTLRRWLTTLVEQGKVSKQGAKRNTTYQLATLNPTQTSLRYIQQPIFKRVPKQFHFQWLKDYQPNVTRFIEAEYTEYLAKVGYRAMNHDLAGTYAHKIYERFLVDLSFNSSRLEGNTYSLLETEKLVLEGQVNSEKLEQETVMILNHKEAIRYLVEHPDKKTILPEDIQTLHYLLADGLVPAKAAGHLRKQGVRNSASTYIPPESSSELTEGLIMICEKASLIEDPFEKSFFLLVFLAYLQAFIDVNKRTSRLSANIPLIHGNFVPLSFNDVKVNDYITALLVLYELNDSSLLKKLYIGSYLKTCRAYDDTVQSVGYDEIRVTFRQQRRQLLAEIITQKVKGTKLNDFIQHRTLQLIPVDFQQSFIETINEDLALLSFPRLAGLGITREQFQEWQRL